LALALAVPARMPGLVRRLLPCSLSSSAGSTVGTQQLEVELREAGAPAWAIGAIEAVASTTTGGASGAAPAGALPTPLCMLLPANANRGTVARAELGAYLVAVHSGLRSALSAAGPAAAAEPPMAEARAALVAHRHCCREAAAVGCGLSPLAAAVEGARMARVLARAQAAARAQGRDALLAVAAWLRDAGKEDGQDGSLDEWAARLAAATADARRRGASRGKDGLPSSPQALYEVAVAECFHGILLAESAAAAAATGPEAPAPAPIDATAAAAPLARGLEAWRALCSSSADVAVDVDPQLARQCFEALVDHLAGEERTEAVSYTHLRAHET